MYKSIIKKILLSIRTISGQISLLVYLNLEENLFPVLLVTITVYFFNILCKKKTLILFVSILIIIILYTYFIA